MVGIYKREPYSPLYAVSENEDTAIAHLYKEFANPDYYGHLKPREWWDVCKKYHMSAANAFDIRNIKVV